MMSEISQAGGTSLRLYRDHPLVLLYDTQTLQDTYLQPHKNDSMQITFAVDGVIELSRNLRLASDGMREIVPKFHKEAIDIVKNRSDEIFD